MKKCPTCEKTFEDSMRFCQLDGTPLVADEPIDPYKTMVASKDEIAAAMPREFTDAAKPPAEPEPESSQEEVLDLPQNADPKKTMFVSEDELRREMGADEPVMDIPPKPEPPAAPPEPPKFSEPAPPPTPFSAPSTPLQASEPKPDSSGGFSKTSPPIPSPFSTPKAEEPKAPKFAEPEKPADDLANPFNAPKKESIAPADWTPPPAPDASWEKQEIGENTPFQPPPAGQSLNQTMAFVSLGFGIISLCCWISPLTGIVALVTGFLARKNIKSDPAKYGGGTFALIGMILGGIMFLIGVGYYVLNILVYMGMLGGSLLQGY